MVIRDDLQEVPGSAIPTFATPPSWASDEPLPEVDEPAPNPQTSTTVPANPTILSRFGLGGSKPAAADVATRTGISSPASDRAPRVGVKEATIALAGLLSVVTLGAAWLIQRKTGGKLTVRQPTGQQSDDIAAPVARIAARFIPAELLAPSVADAIAAMSAAGAYATDGPIIVNNRPTEHTEETS